MAGFVSNMNTFLYCVVNTSRQRVQVKKCLVLMSLMFTKCSTVVDLSLTSIYLKYLQTFFNTYNLSIYFLARPCHDNNKKKKLSDDVLRTENVCKTISHQQFTNFRTMEHCMQTKRLQCLVMNCNGNNGIIRFHTANFRQS